MYRYESWTIKKAERWRIHTFELWCWRRLLRVPSKTRRSNQSSLKEINHEYSFGRVDAEAPILWPPDAKSWLIGKDPDAGKDWEQEKGAAEDEIVRWHHQLSGHKSEQTPEDRGFSGALDGKESAHGVGDRGSIPESGRSLEKEMATHSNILAWRILWTEDPGRLQSVKSQRVRRDWAMNTFTFLEIVEDREAWCATVHEVTNSQTQFSDWTAMEHLGLFLPLFYSEGEIGRNKRGNCISKCLQQ